MYPDTWRLCVCFSWAMSHHACSIILKVDWQSCLHSASSWYYRLWLQHPLDHTEGIMQWTLHLITHEVICPTQNDGCWRACFGAEGIKRLGESTSVNKWQTIERLHLTRHTKDFCSFLGMISVYLKHFHNYRWGPITYTEMFSTNSCTQISLMTLQFTVIKQHKVQNIAIFRCSSYFLTRMSSSSQMRSCTTSSAWPSIVTSNVSSPSRLVREGQTVAENGQTQLQHHFHEF